MCRSSSDGDLRIWSDREMDWITEDWELLKQNEFGIRIPRVENSDSNLQNGNLKGFKKCCTQWRTQEKKIALLISSHDHFEPWLKKSYSMPDLQNANLWKKCQLVNCRPNCQDCWLLHNQKIWHNNISLSNLNGARKPNFFLTHTFSHDHLQPWNEKGKRQTGMNWLIQPPPKLQALATKANGFEVNRLP